MAKNCSELQEWVGVGSRMSLKLVPLEKGFRDEGSCAGDRGSPCSQQAEEGQGRISGSSGHVEDVDRTRSAHDEVTNLTADLESLA